MQKKLIALAIAGIVSAPMMVQNAVAAAHMGPKGSSVTLYGTFDAGVRHQDNADGNGNAVTTMNSSGTYNSNRWGMKGSEDLGNGLKANFTLEGGFLTGTGQMDDDNTLFRRKAIVGLSGNWGALDLGRNYTSIFYTTGAYDPFHYKYTGIIPIAGLDGARRNNTITYTSPKMNGLLIRANHAFGEVVGSSGALSNDEVGASYGNGPFSVGIAYGRDKDATNTLSSKQWTIGGAYKMNPFEVMVGYDVDKTDVAGGGDTKRKVSWVGGRYQLSGPNAVSLAYYHDKREAAANGTKKLWILGFVHNLSTRTEFYADIDSAKVDGTLKTGTDDSNLGISVGINHAF